MRWRKARILQAVLDARDDSGQLICNAFLRLPSKKIYPDYYSEISNPLSLLDIKKKLKRNEYPSLESFMSDIDLVFKNAQQYNVEESQIFRDSCTLQQIAHLRFQEMLNYQKSPSKRIHSTSQAGEPLTARSRIERTLGSQYTPLKRPRKSLTAEEAKTKRLRNLFNTVYNYVAEDGHRPRDVFLELPSKEQYPDYYKVIPEPIDLAMIRRKMDQNEYNTHQEMVSDLRLMFNNARHYNEEGSGVYEDAVILGKVVTKRLKSFGPYQTNLHKREASLNNTGSHISSGQPVGPTNDFYHVPVNVVAPPNTGPSHLQTQPGMSLLQRVLLELFQTIREYNMNGRQLSAPFMRLPTRAELPSYYEFIKKPIELQTIAKQLVQMRYTDFDEFVADLFLMFDNACRFNEPDSQIYADTLTLHRVCLSKRAMLLNTFGSHLGLPPATAPDVGTGIRRLLTNMHNAMLTACDPDGRGLVDSLIAGDGTETTLTSVTAARLAALHRAVAAGSYRRLDRLQDDWLKILKRARIGEGDSQPKEVNNPLPTFQQRQDAAELARRWVRLRDELCHRQHRGPAHFPGSGTSSGNESASALPSHVALFSRAMSYTVAYLDRELLEEEEAHPLSIDPKDIEEGSPVDLITGETELQEITVSKQLYRIGDYVYVTHSRLDATQRLVGRIVCIRQSEQPKTFKTDDDAAQTTQENEPSASLEDTPNVPRILVHVAWYWRPAEAAPSRRRRLLPVEVFRTSLTEAVAVDKLSGHCLVLPISQFIRFRPKNVDERDLFVCESHFCTKSGTFIKIRNWSAPTPVGIDLEQRQVAFVPTRLPPNEPLENALEQVNTRLFTDMSFPLPRCYESIILEDHPEDEDVVTYEQYVHENGFLVKLGDFLYVPAALDSTERHIVRVDKLWKSISQNVIFFSGPWFIAPSATEHLPTRVFYPKEVFLTSADHGTHALASAIGKCYVMRPVDYCQARPTEYNEHDVYLCDSKYFEDEKVIRKLKKGLKRFELSMEALDDEFFFFPQPIYPRKEGSPLLSQASAEPLSEEQLNRPASTALSCALAASSGTATPVVSNVSSALFPETAKFIEGMNTFSGPSGSNALDKGQIDPSSLALGETEEDTSFYEAGYERSRRRRKLRKPPSGYVLYAGEVRKRLLQERRDAPFGEISREVGQMWRQMSTAQRDHYERRAKLIKRRMEEEQARQEAKEKERIQLQIQQQLATAKATMPPDVKPNLSFGLPRQSAPIMTVPVPVPSQGIPGTPVIGQSTVGHFSGVTPSVASGTTMQFYQTPSGQVIQVMHSQSSTTSAPIPNHQIPAAATTSTYSQSGFGTSSSLSSGCQMPSGTHHVVYQIHGQPATVVSAAQVGSSAHQPAYYTPNIQQTVAHPQQRLVVGSAPGAVLSGPPPLVGATPNQAYSNLSGSSHMPHVLLASTAGNHPSLLNTSSAHHIQPNPSASVMNSLQCGPRVASLMPAVATELISHTQQQSHFSGAQSAHASQQVVANATSGVSTPGQILQLGSSIPSGTPIAGQLVSGTVQQLPQQNVRPPSPIFVSTPPRTSRVLHSEIYQRYINRLKKNAPGGLSDWRHQLSVSAETAPNLSSTAMNQLAGTFLANPQNHAHHSSVTEAVWSLRDHLLEDALKIRLRCLSVECL